MKCRQGTGPSLKLRCDMLAQLVRATGLNLRAVLQHPARDFWITKHPIQRRVQMRNDVIRCLCRRKQAIPLSHIKRIQTQLTERWYLRPIR